MTDSPRTANRSAAPDIETPRLILRQSTIGRLSALITGPHEYERVFGHKVADGYIEYPDVLVFSMHQARAFPEDARWWLPYLVIHRAEDTLIGACGYKGPPDGEGVVEIGYGIAPAHRGLGLVTEAAALTDFAFSTPGITAVRAHTRPEPNASTRILAKCGFIRTGDYHDPEEGLLWEWLLAAENHQRLRGSCRSFPRRSEMVCWGVLGMRHSL